MKVLVFGVSGMIGSSVLRVLCEKLEWQVFGTVRSTLDNYFFNSTLGKHVIEGIDVNLLDSLIEVLDNIKPNVVVNCVGITKHKVLGGNPLDFFPINSLMPHRLANLCNLIGARLIHVSTDCVFSGQKGNYIESDIPDAIDVYGRSKALGELYYPFSVTLRTSTIGHELHGKYGLLDWFLSQEEHCKGYTKAVFSGLPTIVFAQVIRDLVIPRPELSGLYHVAAKPINKFELLKLIAEVYGKNIEVIPSSDLVIDRSLDAKHFEKVTGYIAPEWPELIEVMHTFK
jgi:dTDP-4-dehydrorhamnose reductase